MRQFSVLMSVYKNEKPEFLKLSLASIFSQTVPPTEVVLVEDGPLTDELNDTICKISDEHKELKVYPFSENRGLGKALHDGVLLCKHDIIARMDTDDICVPERFEKELMAFEKDPDLDVCSAWIDEFESDFNDIVSVRKLPESHNELYRFGKKRNPVSHPVSMFRKEAVLKSGNYQDFPLFEDYYLWARMMVNGCKFYCIQESLLKFRRSPEMIKRRGGWMYAMTEMRFFNELRRIGYISWPLLVQNIAIRFTARIVPNSLRTIIYKNIRKRSK